jgi:Domain of unknown function (DUF222)/HNH endonuclease
VSELRSAIEALDVLVLAELPDALIEEGFAEVRRARERLEVIELRFLAEADRRHVHARDGHLSTTSWLASVHKSSAGAAKAQVETARALEQMPLTSEALGSGEISMSAAKMLVYSRQVNPDAFGEAEPYLVQAARIHSFKDLSRVLAYWRQRAELESDPDLSREEALYKCRGLRASLTFEGMVRLDADLDPETGELLQAALASVRDAEARSRTEEDTRTMAQLNCDALGEILRQYLDRSDRPEVAGEHPHLTVMVGAVALAEAAAGAEAGAGAKAQPGAEGPCELDNVGPISPQTALRLACDASVTRVVMSADSEPLDVGRRTAIVPAGMRRAVIARDRHCRFPGCDRPQSWCDAHHIVHWARGGPTSVSNLVLLCRRHHRLVHGEGGFRLAIEEGKPMFRRPDGGRLESTRPESHTLDGRGPALTAAGRLPPDQRRELRDPRYRVGDHEHGKQRHHRDGHHRRDQPR